jgi:restriction endonuclease Mrr
MPRLAVLAIATSWLTGCATAGFDAEGLAACPPAVEYSRELQSRAAEEMAMLPDGSAIVEMMRDYAVMREQTRVCF